MNKIQIIPAILPSTFDELESKISSITSLVPWVQIDIVDGVYAPNKTWPYTNDEKNTFSKLVRQEQHISSIEDVNFEIDLMVSDPTLDADRWIAVGARRLVIHIKSITLEYILSLAKNIKDKGVELVLGFAVDDDVEKLKSYIDGIQNIYPDRKMIDGIQCMGIEKEGYQHQSFDKKVLDNVLNIKKLYSDIPISIDGSVNLVTAKELVDAGVTRLIIGSALFDKGSVEENLKTFCSLV